MLFNLLKVNHALRYDEKINAILINCVDLIEKFPQLSSKYDHMSNCALMRTI